MKRLSEILVAMIFTCMVIQAQEYTIKFATVAPQGTTWYNLMKEYDDAVRKESGGRLGFRIYAGGTAGDEKDVLRKIRVGQMHAGGFTGNGLGDVAPLVRVLDAPFLFKSDAESDAVVSKFEPEFQKAFEDGGYVLLGWADVGFVYVFTKNSINNIHDLKGVKMWMWEGDPIPDAAFKVLGVSPIPLSLTDVLTSLQTGLIDGVYGSPLVAISMQWFARVKYMLEIPLADSHGAILISKKEFDKLPKDLQDILVKDGRIYMRKLTEASRIDNKKSLDELKKNGITFIPITSEKERAEYEQLGKQARQMLVGKLFDQSFLDRVEQTVRDVRKNSKGAK